MLEPEGKDIMISSVESQSLQFSYVIGTREECITAWKGTSGVDVKLSSDKDIFLTNGS